MLKGILFVFFGTKNSQYFKFRKQNKGNFISRTQNKHLFIEQNAYEFTEEENVFSGTQSALGNHY